MTLSSCMEALPKPPAALSALEAFSKPGALRQGSYLVAVAGVWDAVGGAIAKKNQRRTPVGRALLLGGTECFPLPRRPRSRSCRHHRAGTVRSMGYRVSPPRATPLPVLGGQNPEGEDSWPDEELWRPSALETPSTTSPKLRRSSNKSCGSLSASVGDV